MKVHLRLTEKDVDLCRWRHSVKKGMMTYYIGQILLSEALGKIACLPTALRPSAKKDPCDVYMVFTDPQIIEFLLTFPAARRNATLKRIIRKHLEAQNGQSERDAVYQDRVGTRAKKPMPPKEPERTAPKADKPITAGARREIVESEEDRAAILALIAMGGE